MPDSDDATLQTLPASGPRASAPRPSDPLAGSSYRAIRFLGRGATGEVLEAEHVALCKRVVVKLLHRDLSRTPALVDRMRLEAQTAARIHHPHLVEVSDSGHTLDGRPFFVMEMLSGRNLREELQVRGHIPVTEALDLAEQLLSGLSAIHRVGLVHRDIKLENLFLCDPVEGRRTLKILDFGIVKVLPSATAQAPAPLALPTQAGVALGTPRFLAPEQALGLEVDARADVYGAGIVLYALLAGVDPFQHLTDKFKLLYAHVTEQPRRPSEVASQIIDADLDGILLKALAKKPADRYSNADEFAEALAEWGRPRVPSWSQTEPLDRMAFPAVVPSQKVRPGDVGELISAESVSPLLIRDSPNCSGKHRRAVPALLALTVVVISAVLSALFVTALVRFC